MVRISHKSPDLALDVAVRHLHVILCPRTVHNSVDQKEVQMNLVMCHPVEDQDVSVQVHTHKQHIQLLKGSVVVDAKPVDMIKDLQIPESSDPLEEEAELVKVEVMEMMVKEEVAEKKVKTMMTADQLRVPEMQIQK
tara:strand:- start:48 stop:458 length:411 start_codon:yes stop_codon:yes gene_type:complete